MRSLPLLNLTLAVALALMIGWLLIIGRGLLLPIIIAVIVVYILTSASAALKRLPGFKVLPPLLITLLLLVGFTLCFVALALIVSVTIDQLIQVAPQYQANLQALATQVAALVDMDKLPNWSDIQAATLERIDVQQVLLWVIGGLTSFGSSIFLVIVYAAFLVGERVDFPAKVAAAFPNRDQADRLRRVIGDINRKIGDYLAVKTLINIILAVISYAIMALIGVDFALFWAVLIGLTNYIPYFGSLIGVMLPVVLSLAQFASLSTTLLLAVLLTTAQTYVGNVLEPRMIGRELNLSPFVVLVALSLWSALWGLPGAILAVPMTSMIAIILGSFPQTRFAAILLSEKPATTTESAGTRKPS